MTEDTEVWWVYEPQRIPLALGEQWPGLLPPPQDWQRLTGGEAWGPRVATDASRRPVACVEPDAARALVTVAWAARATDAVILELVEEGGGWRRGMRTWCDGTPWCI